MYIFLFFFQIWPFFLQRYQRSIPTWVVRTNLILNKKKDGQRLNFITTGTGKRDRYSLYLPVVFQTEVQTKLLI